MGLPHTVKSVSSVLFMLNGSGGSGACGNDERLLKKVDPMIEMEEWAAWSTGGIDRDRS